MQEQIEQLIFYAKGAWNNKWLALIAALIICLGGWTLVALLPNKYVSESKVHVETKTMLQPLMRGMTVQSDTAGLLRVMQILIFTRTNLEQIIKLSDLDENPGEIDLPDIVEKLKKEIKIEGGHDDIFTIKYESTSPSLAKNVVQAVLTVFSDQTHQNTLAGTDVAQKFINDQIHDYEVRLRNAEQAKEHFKRANYGFLPEEGAGASILAQNTASLLDDAKLQLNEAVSRQKTLRKQLNDIKESNENWAVADSDGGLAIDKEENARIETMSLRKNELLLRFTENHPEIVSINKKLKEFEDSRQKRKKAEKASMTEDDFVKPNVIANPYVQTIKVALNEADTVVASAQARVDELQMRVDKIKGEMQARLTVETELQNLNRDYDAIKNNYTKLLESREQASMSAKVDDQAEALKFKIADAPNIPLKPSSPKRVYFYSGLLIVGFIFGFGLSLLVYMAKPTIMSITQLASVTGLPVLGGIFLKNDPIVIAQSKKDMIRYFSVILGLLLIYFGFMAIEIFEINVATITSSLHRVI